MFIYFATKISMGLVFLAFNFIGLQLWFKGVGKEGVGAGSDCKCRVTLL